MLISPFVPDFTADLWQPSRQLSPWWSTAWVNCRYCVLVLAEDRVEVRRDGIPRTTPLETILQHTHLQIYYPGSPLSYCFKFSSACFQGSHQCPPPPPVFLSRHSGKRLNKIILKCVIIIWSYKGKKTR